MTLRKKGEGEVTRIALGIIIMAMFVGSAIAFMVDVEGNYDLNVDTDEFATFNNIAELQGNITIVSSRTIEQDSGTFGPENDEVEALLRAGFKSEKFIFSLPNIMLGLITDAYRLTIGNQIALPPIYFFGIISIVTLLTFVSVMGAIFKVRP